MSAPGASWPPASSGGGLNCTGCAGRSAKASACSCSRGWADWASRRSPSTRSRRSSTPGTTSAPSGARTPRRPTRPRASPRRWWASSWTTADGGSDWGGKAWCSRLTAIPGADPAQRFRLFLQVLVENAERLVVYLDNLESLLIGPEEVGPADPEAFGQWRTPALQAIWETLVQIAGDTAKLVVVASCRYRNDDFRRVLIPVGPLPAGALFRLDGVVPRPAAAVGRVAGPAGAPAGRPPAGRRVRQRPGRACRWTIGRRRRAEPGHYPPSPRPTT